MQVRKFAYSDSEEIIEIWYNASIIAHSFIAKELWALHKEDLREKYLPNSETWVAVENGEVVGFISLMDDYIGALFVAPTKQGIGVGTKLLEHAQQNKGSLNVGVYERNLDARSFYEKKGFRYLSKEIQSETGETVVNMKWIK